MFPSVSYADKPYMSGGQLGMFLFGLIIFGFVIGWYARKLLYR